MLRDEMNHGHSNLGGSFVIERNKSFRSSCFTMHVSRVNIAETCQMILAIDSDSIDLVESHSHHNSSIASARLGPSHGGIECVDSCEILQIQIICENEMSDHAWQHEGTKWRLG